MWLDRFSGQSTPTGIDSPFRAHSPAPRKSSHLTPASRGGLGLGFNRSNTSLDFSPNVSNVSLPSSVRAVNGSTLKYDQKPPPDIEDPTKVLHDLLGERADKGLPRHGGRAISDPPRGLDGGDIGFQGLSLEEFVDRGHTSPPEHGKNILGKGSRQKFDHIHNSITESDDVLASVESYLTNFKAELGQVSAEIENLQDRSTQLNAKLENRRQVEKLLGPKVEEVSIAPATVRAIAEGPVDDAFVEALIEVEARSALLDGQSDTQESIKALEDIKPLLNDLKAKAIERCRDYIVSQVKALRSPNINAQLIQQQSLVKYKDLFSFLHRHHPVLAEEISQAYVNTLKWYYTSNFTRYQQALEKLQVHHMDQQDLIGVDPSAKRGGIGVSKQAQPQNDAFILGKRADILRSKNDSAIPSYLAEDSKSAHHLEVPFRHFNQALIDNVGAEYTAASEIFTTRSYQQVSRKVVETFEPTFTLGHNFTKQLIENSTDCLGILLCVRLNQHFAFEAQRRKVPVADSYINYTNILLWPRFQQVMDQHCESLKKVQTTNNRGAAAAFSLVGGNDASKASVAPHAITQRFGQFLHGILSLSTEAGDDEPLSRSLDRLRSEYETLMTKMSKGAGDASRRARFLFNNYSLVATIIGDAQGKLAQEQKERLSSLLAESKVK